MALSICMLLHKSVVHDSRVRREASALAEAGHRVTVIELDPGAAGDLDGFCRVSAAPPRWVRRGLPKLAYRAVFLAAFIRRIRQLGPDVVHAHDAAMLVPGLIGARLTGAGLVYDSHELATGVPYRGRVWARLVAAVERVAIHRAGAVITVTDGIADRLQELYRLPRRPDVVRNTCALRPTSPTGVLRRALGIGDSPLVLHQGAAAIGRGCETLVEAMAAVPVAHLVFLGDGEPGFAEHLERLAIGRGVGNRVHFRPSVPLEQLLSLTAEADVGVSLLQDTCENHRLALPNKFFEYVGAGVPVVASDLPELRQAVMDNGVGWTVDQSSAAAVGDALSGALQACDDPALRERLRAAAARLNWEHEQERLVAIYRRLARPEATLRPDALVLVRNTVSYDARVLRAARTLADAGWRPLVAGVAGGERSGCSVIEGISVVRLRSGARVRMRRARGWTAADPSSASGRGAASAQVSKLRRLHRLAIAGAFLCHSIGLILRLRPRLVHANDHNTMWAGIAAKVLAGSHLVYDAHELWPDRNGRWEWRPWLLATEALFVRAADRVITASPGYSECMAARYRIPPPAVVRNVPAQRRSARAAAPEPIAVYVGGMMPGRGLEQALSALALTSDVRLRLLGPGRPAYVESLRRQALELGVDHRLELLPPVAPGAVLDAIADAAVGLNLIQPICTSYRLTLPNKLFEYVAAGVPVLSSDVPVSAAFVREHGIGEVVPAGDPVAIARALERMLGSEAQAALRARVGAAGDGLTWEREREVLLAAYEAPNRALP